MNFGFENGAGFTTVLKIKMSFSLEKLFVSRVKIHLAFQRRCTYSNITISTEKISIIGE